MWLGNDTVTQCIENKKVNVDEENTQIEYKGDNNFKKFYRSVKVWYVQIITMV